MYINYDISENIHKTLINHGKYSNRIYLMKLHDSDYPEIIYKLHELALKNGYTKIFAKVPSEKVKEFLAHGYKIEAKIPGFYNQKSDGFFLGKFYDDNRAKEASDIKSKMKDVLQSANEKARETSLPPLDSNYTLGICSIEDAQEMSLVYQKVFKTYPFPIHDYEYLQKMMKADIIYFYVKYQEKIAALSSAEIDYSAQNAEMTDFATLNEYRGKSLSLHLLMKMEEVMKQKGIQTVYTIARALSYGMNITFAKYDYNYAGTLIKNTNISGNLESMNIWYKKLIF